MITDLHLRLQFSDDILIRIRPCALERIEDDVCMCLLLFQQPTYSNNRLT